MSNKYNITVITPPASEVLTLTEVKTHLRVDSTDDDTLISSLLVAAREYAEKYTARRFVTQTLQLSIDNFFDWYTFDSGLASPWYQYIELPYPPTSSITTISYLNQSNSWATLDSSIYQTDFVSEPARIYHAYNQSFPVVQQVPQAVKIVYVTGYGAASAVPSGIKGAMKLLIGHWYEHRTEVEDYPTFEIPRAAKSLLDIYKVVDL